MGGGRGAWSGLGAFQSQVTPVAAGDRTEGLPAESNIVRSHFRNITLAKSGAVAFTGQD